MCPMAPWTLTLCIVLSCLYDANHCKVSLLVWVQLREKRREALSLRQELRRLREEEAAAAQQAKQQQAQQAQQQQAQQGGKANGQKQEANPPAR